MMSQKHFEFADFVDEFKVDFTVYDQQDGYYNNEGKWIEGVETPRAMNGIILPLSNDELRFEANGAYTRKDRKVYTTTPLEMGQKLDCNNQTFTVDSEKPYNEYADVYIYFAKGVE